MLQRLEELLGQKLTSEDDATKLKKLSDAEMERINTVVRSLPNTRLCSCHTAVIYDYCTRTQMCTRRVCLISITERILNVPRSSHRTTNGRSSGARSVKRRRRR